MNEDDVAAGEFRPAGHPVLDEFAVVADELKVQALHIAARDALARRRQLDVAETLAEGEIGRLDGVLDQRSVDLVGDRVHKGRVAFEFGEPERQARHLTTVSITSAMMSCAWSSSAPLRKLV